MRRRDGSANIPWDIFEKVAEKGYTGVAVPRNTAEWGWVRRGRASPWNNSVVCPGRVESLWEICSGPRQIIEFGSEEQKSRFLPRIAKGEMGAVVITEPVAGTDAAAIAVTAKTGWRQVRSERKEAFYRLGRYCTPVFCVRKNKR